MAILTPDEIRNMSRSELEEQLDDLELERAKEMGKVAIGGFPENTGRIKEIRRTIARIKTILNQEEQ
ncbi:MAG: 50S ribosomal protein L29 [Candidatus Nanohaloarchaea archaeon]|nr:50S ribosomal protein L29 [Candidatus Nanohaloarchaea archaeon]